MHEAKSQLSRLARLAREGEDVVICNSGRPWVRLTPYRASVEPRQPGGLEGQIVIGPDFDDDDDEIIAAFEDSPVFPSAD
ncbi:MAG: type II toxin-antitoxin system prevent-host-death family antitoxin [Gemmatimonadales bacterium]|nr:type II toxin-antitoxin system prevent-host-death family antitoxin [Gemmatimonadales bacterium]MYG20611.1 type II toxin-antitoxin system prevent-host-death family antitoxin [Gemmatimonadales bacterium]MYH09685.1 type II toxin-antitoxin system prevent-host-death family antitoxin [Gemmatimonadales bacterium]MYL07369.1 type II toxin-antitoxin system prevent-host-death family antitoxin [Gemmatimonadales bacterium]